ncbi:MAG: polysaccharide biosynthesis/export family protein [Candidatus Eisenbacteria bacterium]|nr:polysaccharide biosynthesis/export family protein [Candidatus Eisenbacteria bacterium]
MRRFTLERTAGLLAVAGLLLLVAAPLRAEEYTIGPEDVLQVSVWMHPELERTLPVGTDGEITFPPLGQVKAAGQTPTQLAVRLGDRLSTYLRQTTTVTVAVTQYLSRSVYVSGAVARPGRYGFDTIPGLVDVLNQAGGPTPGADLSQVQLLRREGGARKPITVDVARALGAGSDAGLPELKSGDSILVPGGAGAGAAPAPGGSAGVLGEVNKPGLYAVGAGQDLWTVLAAAGGLTGRGNLADVRVLSRQRDSSSAVVSVDLREELRHGSRSPFVVRAGDVVVVTPTGGSVIGRGWAGFTQVMAISRDVLNAVLIADYFKRNVK